MRTRPERPRFDQIFLGSSRTPNFSAMIVISASPASSVAVLVLRPFV
jgi:hypothetical protein